VGNKTEIKPKKFSKTNKKVKIQKGVTLEEKR
jgi:hypothetical protein